MNRTGTSGLAWLAAAAVLLAPVAASATTVFTDRAVWQASAPGARVVDSFDADIATADTVTFGSGITASKSSTGIPPTLNRVKLGEYDGFLVRDDFRTITWTLPQPATAFGADFNGGGFELSSLFVTASYSDNAAETFSISDALAQADGFFGLSGSRSISSLLFSTDTGIVTSPGSIPLGGQSFSADNVSLGSVAPIAPVPLPAALPLMLGGIGIAGVFGWRRRARPI